MRQQQHKELQIILIKIIIKTCAQFTNCISEINNTQIDHAKYIDIVMSMYNLIEYSGNYSKTCGGLWQYCKDIPAVDDYGDIVDFNGTNATDSFNFKAKITGQTRNDGGIEGVENGFIKILKQVLENSQNAFN